MNWKRSSFFCTIIIKYNELLQFQQNQKNNIQLQRKCEILTITLWECETWKQYAWHHYGSGKKEKLFIKGKTSSVWMLSGTISAVSIKNVSRLWKTWKLVLFSMNKALIWDSAEVVWQRRAITPLPNEMKIFSSQRGKLVAWLPVCFSQC